MTIYHDAVAAVGGVLGTADADKDLLRELLVRRLPYPLGDSENFQDVTIVDPATGALPYDVLRLGRVFHYDPLDTLTAHDNTTCLVSAEGKRYKLVDSVDVVAWSVISSAVAPPASPAPALGDAYRVLPAATGDWAGYDNYVAVYTAHEWEFVDFAAGRLLYHEDEAGYYHRTIDGLWEAGLGAFTVSDNTLSPAVIINASVGGILRVENLTTTLPPALPTLEDAYIVGPSATGAWAGKDNYVALCIAAGGFALFAPKAGYEVYDKSTSTVYRYNGTSWQSAGGSCVAAPLPQFDSGNTFTNTSGSAFNWTTAGITVYPSSATNAHLKDPLTITHTAKKSGNLLEFEFDLTPGSNWHLNAPVFCLMRDSESAPLDKWETYDASTKRNVMKFSVVASDALSHVYRIYVFGTNGTYGGFNSTSPPFYNRRFSVKEYSQ